MTRTSWFVTLSMLTLFLLGVSAFAQTGIVAQSQLLTVNQGEYYEKVIVEDGGLLVLNGGAIGTNEASFDYSVEVNTGGRFVIKDGLLKDFRNYGVMEAYGGFSHWTPSNRGYLKIVDADVFWQIMQLNGTINYYGSGVSDRENRELYGDTEFILGGSADIILNCVKSPLVPGEHGFSDLPFEVESWAWGFIHEASFWSPNGVYTQKLHYMADPDWTGHLIVRHYDPSANGTDVPVLMSLASSNGMTQAGLTWAADGGSIYEPLTTTNLIEGQWTPLGPGPISPTNLICTSLSTTADDSRFFRVRVLDTEGPDIVDRYPATNAIGIALDAPLIVSLQDQTGVDTNSFALTINGEAPLTSWAPGILVGTNGFQYTPSTNVWGTYGSTATVELVCADIIGNASTSSWSFSLEIQAVVTNGLVHLPAPSGGTPSALYAAMAQEATRRAIPFSDNLTIISMDTNQVIIAYTGGSHGLSTGTVLINHDPENYFYRRITSISDDPATSTVRVQTVHVQLTDIVQEGSFSPVSIAAPQATGYAPLWDLEFGHTIPFAHESELTILPIDINENVRLVPGRFWIDLAGSLAVSFTIDDWDIEHLDASISSEISSALRASVEFRQAVALLDWNDTIGTPITLISIPIGYIPPGIPVWVEIQLAMGWGASVTAEGAVTFETGVDVYVDAETRLEWTPDGWNPSKHIVYDITPVPLDIEFQLSAEAYLYLRSQLQAVLCPVRYVAPDGLAGVYLEYKTGPALEAVPDVIGGPQCEFTLSAKQSMGMGLTVVGVNNDSLPNLTLFEAEQPIETWYWPEIAEQAPVFSRHPSGVTASAGELVTLTASATGNPLPTYQWYKDHIGIPFKTDPQLSFTASSRSAGDYYVRAANRLGQVTSQDVTVTVTSGGTAPSGMAYIPAGTFLMGDSFAEGSANELPVHSVYVSAFCMDKYEVTNDEMVDVLNWAHGQGKLTVSSSSVRNAEGNAQELLDLDDSDCRIQWNGSQFVMKSAKGSGYPCVEVTWYGAVAYCNYRTLKEGGGRTPCYSFSDWSCNWSATGYRLPTEAEWEKAARGGLSGQRFPWGANINHDHANYEANGSAYTYDTSPYTSYTHHPDYDDGGFPYTSPVGTFESGKNGYGLYDMAGNVWEWCNDWYGASYYGSSPGSDPRGPASGSHRVRRGGGWGRNAGHCRVGDRHYINPNYASNGIGFRAVLPPGQQ